MPKVIRDKLGPIPDDHFENEPCGPPKNVSPLSQAMLDHIEKLKAELEKCQPGDAVSGC